MKHLTKYREVNIVKNTTIAQIEKYGLAGVYLFKGYILLKVCKKSLISKNTRSFLSAFALNICTNRADHHKVLLNE